MGQVPALESELSQAYSQLRNTIGSSKKARYFAPSLKHLVLAYAAECGLKARYMREARLSPQATTNELKGKFGDDGHDLKKGMQALQRELGIPAGTPLANLIDNAPDNIKTKLNAHLPTRTSCGTAQAHQCWRYGIKLERISEAGITSWHQQIMDWLKNEGV